jgi:hypothetical protein
MAECEFTAQIEDDGDLMLEWYVNKGTVVTVCFNAAASVINWAALVDGVSHHGCIKGAASQSDPGGGK